MKFPYQEHPRQPSDAFPNVTSRLVPFIPVTVIYHGKSITIDALVDSGADNCIFPGFLGVALGVEVHEGPKQLISGLGARVIEARFHYVQLKVRNVEIEVYAGFTFDTIGTTGLLGQRGFFDNFKVVFDRVDNCVIVNQRSFLQKVFTAAGL